MSHRPGLPPGWHLAPPEPLRDEHDRSAFDSGAPDLDDWLQRRAQRAEGLSARTFVFCDGGAVIAYYCLATGSLARRALPSARLRQNLPDVVPVVVLGRLAVARRYQGHGLGAWLLRDAVQRALALSGEIGFRGIMVNALDDAAAGFYRRFGFLPCTPDPHTLILPLDTAAAALR